MIKLNNSKQITINKQHRLGSHEEQPLLFSLVHLILCSTKKETVMKSPAILGPIAIGAILLLYIFTFGEIWNNHSVQSYLVMCTGVLSINIGLLAIAIVEGRK